MEEDKKILDNTNQCKSIYTILKEFIISIYIKIKPFIIEWWLMIFIASIVLIIISSFGYFYFSKHNLIDVSKKVDELGQMGDFFGGILNPTLAFLSFCLLLITIKIQSKELKNSTEELAKSSEALTEQSKSLKIQNFENTFFNMLNLHNEIITNLSLVMLKKHFDEKDYEYISSRSNNEKLAENNRIYKYTILNKKVNVKEVQDYNGKKVISKLFEIANTYIKDNIEQSINKLYNNFYLEYNEITGHYFRNIYQILKFIDTQEVLKDENEEKEFKNKKFYANILRSQLSNSELALLLLNGISKEGEEKLLPLIIKFEFMEPLSLSITEFRERVETHKSIFNISYLEELTKLYIEKARSLNINGINYSDNKIFGSNKEWGKYINYINISSQEQQ